MNISLSPDLESFVQNLVLSGSYSGPNEVLDAALRMLKGHEELRRKIRTGIDELDRGEYREYDELSLTRFSDDIKETEEELFGQSPSAS